MFTTEGHIIYTTTCSLGKLMVGDISVEWKRKLKKKKNFYSYLFFHFETNFNCPVEKNEMYSSMFFLTGGLVGED